MDFHGTLSAIWMWSRAQTLSDNDHFSLNIAAGWNFINSAWDQFIPAALGPAAGDEAGDPVDVGSRNIGRIQVRDVGEDFHTLISGVGYGLNGFEQGSAHEGVRAEG